MKWQQMSSCYRGLEIAHSAAATDQEASFLNKAWSNFKEVTRQKRGKSRSLRGSKIAARPTDATGGELGTMSV